MPIIISDVSGQVFVQNFHMKMSLISTNVNMQLVNHINDALLGVNSDKRVHGPEPAT